MAKNFFVKYQATSSAVSAGNRVEKEINSRHALMGTGPQTATGTCPCHPAHQPTSVKEQATECVTVYVYDHK